MLKRKNLLLVDALQSQSHLGDVKRSVHSHHSFCESLFHFKRILSKINSTYMAGKCLGPWPLSEFLDLWSLSCLNVHVHAWLLSVYIDLLSTLTL